MATLTDADLVDRIIDGDTGALAVLYDRYADRIHTMCAHLLRDADEAADVTAEVLLTAAERIGQLRDPDKLRPWLYAIARNEVYRRTRHRRRTTSVADVDAAGIDLRDHLVDDPDGEDHLAAERLDDGDAEVGLEPGADQAALAALLQEAAAGLDDRDRMVLELHLAQGLDGQDLADSLGVSVDHGYQLVHRMKERLERSMSALLVVRGGRELCDGLDEVADRWDGTYSVLWRKRFARHLDRCERCARLRTRLPKAVLAGTALSVAAQASVLAAPVAARERFLSEGPSRVGSPRGPRWRSDGFPPAPRRRSRWVAAAVVGLLLLVGAGALAVDDGPEVVRAAEQAVAPTTTVVERDRGADVTVVGVGEELASEDSTTTTALPVTTTTTAVTTTTRVVESPPPPPPSSTTTSTTTTTIPDSPPAISLSGPVCTNWGSSATFTASVSATAGVASVTLSWNSSTTSGSGPMSGGGSSWSRSIPVASPMTSVNATATVTDAQGRTASASRSMSAGPSCSG